MDNTEQKLAVISHRDLGQVLKVVSVGRDPKVYGTVTVDNTECSHISLDDQKFLKAVLRECSRRLTRKGEPTNE